MKPDKNLYEFYFRHISLFLSFAVKWELEDWDITSQQARLLMFIDHALDAGHSIARRELQKIMGGCSGPSITSLLNALSRKDYLVRRSDDRDGRYMQLSLTQKGKQVVERLHTAVESYEATLISGMSTEEQQIFLELLHRGYTNLVQAGPKYTMD